MSTAYYTTKEERTAAIATALAANETLLNDDFNVGPSGEHQLTFGPVPATKEHDFQTAWDAALTDSAKIDILAQAVGLRIS